MVDSPGLENRYSSEELSRVRIPLSPFARRIELFLYWFLPDRYHKERKMARLSHLAKPEKID